jgi:dienelactone hydrolase
MKNGRMRNPVAITAMGFLLVMTLQRIAVAKIITQVIALPVKVADIKGRTFEHTITVTIIRDDARAKSGFMVMNHGRGVNAEINRKRSVDAYFNNARYFVSKGYAVFLPLRVGYGSTGGPDVEFSGGCNERFYGPVYEAGAVQTIAVIGYVKALPYIDSADGIVVGQSFGGTIAIAMAAKNISGIRAAINFAGGGGGDPVNRPGQPCRPDLLKELFAGYGATARIPTIWLYSENDQYFGPKYPREWMQAFVDRGGRGSFVALPPYKHDGHPSFTGNPVAWKPAVDQFLKACCAAHASLASPPRVSLPSAQISAAQSAEAIPGSMPVFTRVLEARAAKHDLRQASTRQDE